MIILDTVNRTLEVVLGGAVAANELPIVVCYVDVTAAAYTPATEHTVTNGAVTVTIAAAPAAATQRQIKFISIYNADTGAVTLTLKYDDAATERKIHVVTLSVGDLLMYSDGEGFRVMNLNGGMKTTDVAGGPAVGGKGTIWIQPQASRNTSNHDDVVRDNYGGSNCGTAGNDGQLYWSTRIPSDFDTLTKAVVCCLTPSVGGSVRYNVATSFDAAGVAQGTTSDTIGSTDQGMTSLELAELDISAAFTGLAADDILGIKFEREGIHANDTINDFEIYGILLEYTT